jgi:putative redox protein
MGGELFLAAVGGCFMSNLLAAIKARSAPISQVHVAVVGILADEPPRYEALDVRVSAECHDRALLDKLITIADRGCIMTNTLRGMIPLTVSSAPESHTA